MTAFFLLIDWFVFISEKNSSISSIIMLSKTL